eukprot:gene15829-biopygen14287
MSVRDAAGVGWWPEPPCPPQPCQNRSRRIPSVWERCSASGHSQRDREAESVLVLPLAGRAVLPERHRADVPAPSCGSTGPTHRIVTERQRPVCGNPNMCDGTSRSDTARGGGGRRTCHAPLPRSPATRLCHAFLPRSSATLLRH